MDYPEIKDGDTVVLDTETNGLDWKTCHTVGFVVTVERDDKPHSFYYPIRHESGPNLDPQRVINWIKSWADKRIHVVGHNLKFDLHFFANDGIYFPNATFEDTQINGGLIDEHTKSYSLDSLAQVYGAPAKKGDELYQHLADRFGGKAERKQMSNFYKLPADDFLAVDYAMGDGDSTYYLWKYQQPHLDMQDLRRVWELECRCLPVLFRMERKGVKVDEERFEFLQQWLDKQIEAAIGQLPSEDFNVRSNPQLVRAFTDIGITDWPTTPLGNASFVETWLSQSELGRAIISVRKLTNLRSSFVEGQIGNNLHKGRIHANFNQLRADEYGTITGRLSCSVPNLQQVPKRDKFLAPIFRSVFIPDDGCFWSTNDYSQQEYRIFAAYTDSQRLISDYKRGVDMHQAIADMLEVERDPTAKRMNLGMLYWMGAAKLADSLGVSVEQAKHYRALYDERVPEVRKFLKAAQRAGEARGYVRTIMGRRARFTERGLAYKGASRIIQGTCADLMKLKMCEVDEFLNKESNGELGVQIQIHDDLNWSNPTDREDLNEECLNIMRDFSDFPQIQIPMVVDHGRGFNWGQASFDNIDWSQYAN